MAPSGYIPVRRGDSIMRDILVYNERDVAKYECDVPHANISIRLPFDHPVELPENPMRRGGVMRCGGLKNTAKQR